MIAHKMGDLNLLLGGLLSNISQNLATVRPECFLAEWRISFDRKFPIKKGWVVLERD